MLALSDNPSVHNETVESIAEFCGTWWLAHTKSRFEKTFAADCAAGVHGDPDRRINFFIPLIRTRREYAGKRQDVLIPLFASYVFVCGGAETPSNAMATGRLCQIIPVKDQSRLSSELIDLERVIAAESLKIDLYPFAAIGVRVRVRKGPLEGTTGMVIERRGSGKSLVVIQVSMLGQGASLEVDADILEPCD